MVGSRPVPLSDFDVARVWAELYRNGSVESTGTGAACLGNPLHAAVWLADKMSAIGDPLRAGECIMTGALGPTISLQFSQGLDISLTLSDSSRATQDPPHRACESTPVVKIL